MLDYSDIHTIRSVGLYLSRQGALIDWSVEDFLGLLGARHSLPALRATCHHALTNGMAGTALPAPDPGSPFPRPRPADAVQGTIFDQLD